MGSFRTEPYWLLNNNNKCNIRCVCHREFFTKFEFDIQSPEFVLQASIQLNWSAIRWGLYSRLKYTNCSLYKRHHRGVAPADCWNRGKWRLKEYIWKGSFLGSSLARRAGTRDFCPTLVDKVQNIFFIDVHYFTSYIPVSQKAWQALSLNMSLHDLQPPPPIF